MSNNWQLLGVMVTLLLAWSGIIVSVFKIMLSRVLKATEEKLEGKIDAMSSVKDDCDNLERDFLQLKADLPLFYVRREDFIRFDLVINTKLDKLRDLVVEALQGGKHGKN